MSDNHHINLSKIPIGEVNHLDLLSDNIGSLYLNEEYSDVVFIVDGTRFHAHKFILASRSEYFRALLYGGMKESLPDCNEIELKDAPNQAFKTLLKYIYTGKMNLTSQKEETLLETLGLANQYGFTHLESSISDYLKAILTVKNVCMIFDMANLYRLSSLRETCFQFMDRHSTEILDNKIYLSLSAPAMHDMIRRDSFCSPEVGIFLAVREWARSNPELDPTPVLSAVRCPLMSLRELVDCVRPTGLVPADTLLDAIREKLEKRNCELSFRGLLVPEENVATFRHGAHVILGEKRNALLDGDTQNYDLDRGFTRHPIEDPSPLIVTTVASPIASTNGAIASPTATPSGIVIKLGTQCIINHIKILLWDKDQRAYSYYIETSVDQADWVRVVDHSQYLCRSWQNLYFSPRVVRFIRIVGTHNTVNRVFHIIHFEAMYTCKPYKLVDGLVCPNENVAALAGSACVIEGVSRCRNALINGDIKNYDWDSGYTCHQLGSGCIVIQLAQPFYVSSFRLLLWDCDDRSYKYHIQTSIDQVNWEMVVDKSNEPCKSWQNLNFKPRPVIFIRIEGTHNTANEVFHCVHFECPNTLMLEVLPPSQLLPGINVYNTSSALLPSDNYSSLIRNIRNSVTMADTNVGLNDHFNHSMQSQNTFTPSPNQLLLQNLADNGNDILEIEINEIASDRNNASNLAGSSTVENLSCIINNPIRPIIETPSSGQSSSSSSMLITSSTTSTSSPLSFSSANNTSQPHVQNNNRALLERSVSDTNQSLFDTNTLFNTRDSNFLTTTTPSSGPYSLPFPIVQSVNSLTNRNINTGSDLLTSDVTSNLNDSPAVRAYTSQYLNELAFFRKWQR
ncbi:unnamed protein product [Gordionus sp. m RMFG-2023]|uniref:BTB/POZ domain-containing protein 9-like isoform X2 n=1 Tax=Gordionus sp. m RMFG-2023 TaxID=3053472 RepID=UPI0030E5A0BB